MSSDDRDFARDATLWTTYLASDEGRRRALHFERQWHQLRLAEIDKQLGKLDALRASKRRAFARGAS